jgi:diaminopropionate ammonia-lyase
VTDPLLAPVGVHRNSVAMLPRAHRAGARRWSTSSLPGPVRAFHATLPGYRSTPLVSLPVLAAELGVAQVWVKDEGDRFGLPAFKILGSSWAVNRALSGSVGCDGPAGSLAELRRRVAGSPVTLVTATDGNHGRALARMAHLIGVRARIYVPGGLSSAAVDAIAGEGAEVVRTSLLYDEVVQLATRSVAGRPDEVLVQDTSWPGYEDAPRWIVDGYSTLFSEIDDQLGEQMGGVVDLVAVPTGVGSLLQAALQHYRFVARADRPAVLAVEPAGAACVTGSLAAGRPVTVDTSSPSIMAGLNCGTVSAIAWPVIAAGLDAGVGVGEDQARSALTDLHEAGVPVGPCGAAALAGLRVAADDPGLAEALGLDARSVVVLVSTESINANPIPTDPDGAPS